MQTFLPYLNYIRSVQTLDNKRLGKQRVEAMQLINILENKTEGRGWRSHPALKMWVGYTNSLKYYCNCCIDEWVKRGYKNTMRIYELPIEFKHPWWLGDENFHRSHRARLIEKNPDFYLKLFPNDEGFNDSKYFWPVNETRTFKII